MISSNSGLGASLATCIGSSRVGEPSDATIEDNSALPRNTMISILVVFLAIVAAVAVFGIILHHYIHRRAKRQLIVEI